ncbi:MAG TPA: hypothetical protein VJN69_14260 [Candidatus Acidoferrales bacterium]|nr:hypothetical protein [Candidatus Acidoferrales bacterium]
MSSQENVAKRRIFLLSPANLAGRRAEILLREAAKFDLATRVRVNGAPIGEVFSFISGLYFRGKLAYATAFSETAKARHSILIITATRGLVAPHVIIDVGGLVEMASVPISCSDPRYRAPLERDLAKLARRVGKSAEVILLGSIATPKYLEPISKMFGERLLIPSGFVGRGDMSRGAMMLRAVRSMVPLAYAPALSLETGSSR